MPTLTAQQLAYVVTHGELLALLSLQRLEAMLDASPAAPPPTADELVAAEAAVLAELQRHQRLWLDQSTTGASSEVDESIMTDAAAPLATGDVVVVDICDEIEDALAKAYADIPARTQALQGVDTASLAPALAALPEGLPKLTQALDAAGVSAWLDLHDAGDPALGELMEQASALGGSAG